MNITKTTSLSRAISGFLETLCVKIDNRRVGSPGNRAATDFFAAHMVEKGFSVQTPQFQCMDWSHGDVLLKVGAKSFTAFPGPYSPAFSGNTEMVEVSSLAELAGVHCRGKILLLRGECTKEQIMPKNFPFYNPVSHQEFYKLIESKQPAALIAATGKNPELAGGMYPFPLFEDGDFDIPSLYMTDIEGDKLKEYSGQKVALEFESNRIPATGCNVIASIGETGAPRIVICAHIDSKPNTPGALDNGSGVAVLMVLAELLSNYCGPNRIELTAINGEDYYAASGEIQYVQNNRDRFEEIVLAINMDGAGHKESSTAFSLFDCPSGIISTIFKKYGFTEIPPWHQSDHMLFVQNGRPAIALTSCNYMELFTNITHTEADKPDLVDPVELSQIALALRDICFELKSI